jgi:tripartite-type tricarboxylate transporter receptor subunit TctC
MKSLAIWLRTNTLFLSLTMISLSASPQAFGQSNASQAQYPDHGLKIIVPFAPGAALDLMTRAVAQGLAAEIKQPVIVENKAGASGIIGAEATVKAEPDGYTFMVAPFSVLAVNPGLHPNLPYDPVKDFAAVMHIADAPHILIASAVLPFKTLPELKAYVTKNPGAVSYGSAGAGSSAHLATAVLNYQYGLDMVHVPYKGTAPAYNDLIPGRVAVMIDGAAAALPRIKAGQVVALGVTSAKRIAILPDVPTIAEAGVTGYDVIPWYGMVAPKDTPKARIDYINAALVRSLNSDELKKKFADMGLFAVADKPEQFAAFIQTEVLKWKKVIEEAHVKVD